LNPLKRKELVAITAQQLNLPTEQVDDIVSFYYSSLQRKLSSTDHTAIQVPNLGTFVLKRKTLNTKIDRMSDFIVRLQAAEKDMANYGLIQEKLKELNKYQDMAAKLTADYERKKEVTARKIAYKENAKNPK
jgi:nucleoid DNA-binding protein